MTVSAYASHGGHAGERANSRRRAAAATHLHAPALPERQHSAYCAPSSPSSDGLDHNTQRKKGQCTTGSSQTRCRGTRRQSTEYHRQPRAPCRPRPRPGRLMHPSCKCTRADPLCIMDTTWGAAPASPGLNHARGTSTRARARARPKCKKCSSVGEEMHKSDLKFERASKFCPGGSVTRSTGDPTRHTTSWETHVPLQN